MSKTKAKWKCKIYRHSHSDSITMSILY